MAKKVSLDRLDCLKERKDKLVSRLFMKKLELLLEKEKNYLHKCAYCQKLFTKGQRKVLSCSKGRAMVDHSGQIRAKHVIDRSWDLKKFVTFVRETYRISWKEIYWKVWSYLYIFKCERCQEFYPIAEMGNCRFHKQQCKVKASLHGPLGSTYEFECCSQTVDVYEVLNGKRGSTGGCVQQMHEAESCYQVDAKKEKKVAGRIISHQLIILENPSDKLLERVPIKYSQVEAQGQTHTDSSQAQPAATTNTTPHQQIIKPSSLNYKISLSQAVRDFSKYDSLPEDQYLQIDVEDRQISKDQMQFDQLDDSLNSYVPPPSKNNNRAGQSTSHMWQLNWQKEEEAMRKKLERGAIN